MKLLLSLITVLVLAVAGMAQPIKVMSYNIRYNNPKDGINAWPLRKDKVAELINGQKPDIIGLQEVLHQQKVDLAGLLPNNYGAVGVGRDNGKQAGEYACIMYNTNRFKVQQSGTFWLSEKPDVPGSKGWDARIPRICTWAQLADKSTGVLVWVFNTHFDHQGEQARLESAKLLINKMAEMAGLDVVVVTGDFNTTPSSEPYKVMLGAAKPALKDAFSYNHHGPEATGTGFKVDGKAANRIDYIFTSQDVNLLSHWILDTQHNGYYPSDHLPVIAEFELPL